MAEGANADAIDTKANKIGLTDSTDTRQNKVYAGPTSNATETPSFRSLEESDIPTGLPNLTTIGTANIDTTLSLIHI